MIARMKSRRPAVGLVKLERDVGRLDDARRRVLADWCRLVGHRVTGAAPIPPSPQSDPKSPASPVPVSPDAKAFGPASVADAVDRLGLPRRARQVLLCLLSGASEKQIARELSISPHTVHTYVKQLHKRLNVASRGELLSRFLAASPGQ
jgi:DNA-binding CsgD family transcriptional regulator